MDKRYSVSIIRYADDFLILHESLNAVQRCQEIISEWLLDMGLELKPSKTRIAHTLNEHDMQEPGFEFLGYKIRQFSVGKYSSGKSSSGKLLRYKTIIRPSKESVKRHYQKLADTIDNMKGRSQSELINCLNPIIRGWCNYFCTVNSSKTFSKLSALLYWKIRKWAIHRHRKKGEKWLNQRYWRTIGGDNWVFATRDEDNPTRLLKHSEIHIKDYVKVRGSDSPYNGNLIYWSTRIGEHPEMPTRISKLLKQQKGKCADCELTFKDEDVIEIDHIIPKSLGGKDIYENLQLLHRHCHDKKTTRDGS